MCRCSFNSNNALDGLLTKDGVTQATGYMRELLVISPLDLPLVTLVVIVMACSGSILKSLLMVNLLGLGEPGAGRLSPPVIVLKVDVVQVTVGELIMCDLVVFSRDIALLGQVLGANLSDVHVNQIAVVSIDLHDLVGILTIDVDVVVGTDVLVGQDTAGLAVLVTWGIHVGKLHVAVFLLLINLEEEVFLGDNLLIGALSKLFSRDLVFELDKGNFLCNNLVDSLAHINEVL